MALPIRVSLHSVTCTDLLARLAIVMSRPNLLKYSTYMSECSNRLMEDLEFPTDSLIPRIIDLQHVADGVHDSFPSENGDVLPADQIRLQMHLQLLRSELKEWKDRVPPEVNGTSRKAYS